MFKNMNGKSPELECFDPKNVILLIVDDNRFLREVLRNTFRSAGVEQILQAATINEGHNLLRRYEVDVVLLDLQLPDGNGVTLLEQICKEEAASAVIINSYQYNVPLLIRCFRKGAVGYFTKGENKNALINGVLRAARGEWIWTSEQLTQIAEMEAIMISKRPQKHQLIAEY